MEQYSLESGSVNSPVLSYNVVPGDPNHLDSLHYIILVSYSDDSC